MTALALNKRYLIVGAGATGQSVARYLKRSGASFALVDSRRQLPTPDRDTLSGVEVLQEGFKACADKRFDVLVVSPGVALQTPEIVQAGQRGAEIIGDIELFARDINARTNPPQVLAVTGSNGKSTVVSMLGEILRAANIDIAVGGNLGTPALDLLAEKQKACIYVLELSSFQLEMTYSLQLAAASVLNISEDHRDRYATLEEYARIKRTIYRQAQCCVYNAHDSLTWPGSNKNSIAFAHDDQHAAVFFLTDNTLMCGECALMPITDLRVSGRHNVINALAAMALSRALPAYRVTGTAICKGLQRFTGLAHRTQWVGEKDGVDWYNDSKGTNVGATLAAITGMSGPVVLIAGGDGKGANFSPLASVAGQHLRAAVLMGRDGPLIERQLHGKTPIYHANDMQAAVSCAGKIAKPGDSVLLSPACASFDMYDNYMARGDDFIAAVKQALG